MASNNGKRFEDNFGNSVKKQGLLYERFKDNNKFGFSDKTRFSSENPCDCFIFDSEHLYYIELKSTIGTSMSFNQPCDVKIKGKGQPMIKSHQVKALLERNEYDNTHGLLVLDYADRTNKSGKVLEGGTFAIKIQDFYEWANSVDKKSININDAREIGYEISRRRKKVNYEYDVKSLLDVIK